MPEYITSHKPPAQRSPQRAAIPRWARTVACSCAAASLAGLAAEAFGAEATQALPWVLGLMTHWQWLYAVVGGVTGAVALAGRRWGGAVALAVLALTSLRASDPLPEDTVTGGPALRVATANLHLDNRSFGALHDWLLAAPDLDVVMLQEFTPAAAAAVNAPAIVARYPHRLLVPERSPFGLAILSRHPLVDPQAVAPRTPWQTLRLRASIVWDGRRVALSAVHPMPPLSGEFRVARDQTLREEAQWLASQGAFGVLAGDLNDTPWSSGLRSVADVLPRATGLRPSWPQAFGTASVLPLDHVLATRAWRRRAHAPGPHLGSDHRPMTVQLVPARTR